MHDWIVGIGTAAGLFVGLWAVGKYLPGIVVKKMRQGFEFMKNSPWMKNPAKPHRIKWLLATAEMLEEEIPEPGEGKEVYAVLGAKIAASLPILTGSAGKWADALQKGGDAINLELDQEIIDLSAIVKDKP